MRSRARAWLQWCQAALVRAWGWLERTSRLAIGIPDYDAYRQHMQTDHAAATPMTREAFFRERLGARYGRGRSRCC